MLTVTFVRREEWRLLPATLRHPAGWQFHWLFLHLDWRDE